MRIQKIVVGVELGASVDPVLKPSVALARHFGAELHVVHGYMLADPLLDAYSRAGLLGQQTLAQFGTNLQSALDWHVRSIDADYPIHARVCPGSPVTSLLEVTREIEADLIVVGRSRHDRLPLSLLGSSCAAVLRRSPVPVLVIGDDRAVPRNILAPTDLSPLAGAAYRWALWVASTVEGARVRTLLVIDDSLTRLPLDQHLLDRVAEEELKKFAEVSGDDAAVETTIRKGDPAEQIAREAEEWGADLIVMGSHGRRGMDRLILGSITEASLKGSSCNVLVVPPQTAEDGDA